MAGLGAAMPGGPVPPSPPVPVGAGGVPGNPGLPPAPLPAYLVPSPAHGEAGWVMTALHSGDLGRFLTLMNTKMANMNTLLADPNGTGLLTHVLGVQTGPCSFLAVVTPSLSGATQVEVMHCI
jgi:hypothetical protein